MVFLLQSIESGTGGILYDRWGDIEDGRCNIDEVIYDYSVKRIDTNNIFDIM